MYLCEKNTAVVLRDWSVITGRGGGLQNGSGRGAHEVVPLRKGGGGRESFSHAEGGGGTTSFGGGFMQ